VHLPSTEEELAVQLVQDRAASPLSAKVSAGQGAQCVAVSLKVPACGGCGGGVSATTTHPTMVCKPQGSHSSTAVTLVEGHSPRT